MSQDRTTALDAAIRAARKHALAAADSADALDALHAEVELRVLDAKRRVARAAVTLADRWLRAAERVEEEPQDHGTVDTVCELVYSVAAIAALQASIEVAALRRTLDDIAVRRGEAGR